ncbi:MAG: hypothetical protein LBV13_00045 [Methanomassiliicoccaceae archaeon]|jgi:uncharacterized membrane protein HdeD (DUF308 family)|nr:hypothetical protein [Methanomassiliicoccaceae archaeon]
MDNADVNSVRNEKDERRIKAALILFLINAASMMILGLIILINAPEVAAGAFELYEGTIVQPFINDMFDLGSLIIVMQIASSVTVIGGITAAIAAVLTMKRRNHKIIIFVGIISAIAGITTGAGLLIGIAAVWMIQKVKGSFFG